MKNYVSKDYISKLLDSVDIVDVIAKVVPLKKTGSSYVALCPFHSEKTPSFHVHRGKRFYHCFGCGASGNVLSFLMKSQGMSFLDAINYLSSLAGLPPPEFSDRSYRDLDIKEKMYSVMNRAALFFSKNLFLYEDVLNYLFRRGVSRDVIAEYMVGYSGDNWNFISNKLNNFGNKLLLKVGLILKTKQGKFVDSFQGRVMFPIRNSNSGQVSGFGGRIIKESYGAKYMNSPGTEIFLKSSELYGLYEQKKRFGSRIPRIIVVEGYIDVLSLSGKEILGAVATMGTAINKQHFKKMLLYTDHIIVCFDGDDAGRKASKDLLDIVMMLPEFEVDVRFVSLPEGYDPSSFVVKFGKKGFEDEIVRAKGITKFFLDNLMDKISLVEDEGKIRFCNMVISKLKDVPDSPGKFLILRKVAQLTGIDLMELKKMVQKGCNIRLGNDVIRFSSCENKIDLDLVDRMIAFLLIKPESAIFLKEFEMWNKIEHPHAGLLFKLIKVIIENNLKDIVECLHFFDTGEQGCLMKIAFKGSDVPEKMINDHVGAEFMDLARRLSNLYRKQMKDRLIEKARVSGLSAQEQKLLADLLAGGSSVF